jgi:predicted PurR-regulated permease PerM
MGAPDSHPEDELAIGPPQEGDAIGIGKWRKLLTVTATLLCLFALCSITVWLGLRIHHTLLLFALGGLVAYALEPLTAGAQKLAFGKSKRHLGKTASVFAVYGALLLIFIGGAWWLGDSLGHQVTIMQKDAPRYRARAIDMAKQIDDAFFKPRGIAFSAEDAIQNPPPEVNAYAEKVGKSALPILAHTVTNIAEAGVVLLIALYLLVFGSDLKEQANKALSPFLLPYARPWEEDINRILGGFVRGQLILALAAGILVAVGLLLLGVHLWLIIALFTVFASMIPVFGTYVAAIPAVIAALVTPTHLTPVAGAITVVVLFVVINELASKVLYPKLVGRALNLHEVVVLFVLFAGLEIDGVVGALFAAPVASVCVITLVHLYRLWQQLPEGEISDEIIRSRS